MDSRDLKRITVFAGHYGSGKTNIAVNYALKLAKTQKRVSIADLDIVNPYFRTKDSEEILNKHGIRLISSPYANSNVDTPALPAEAYSVIHDESVYSVIDVGGDDRGALALGRYMPDILKQDNFEMVFVINKYRYLTSNPTDTIGIMREIEASAGALFTSVVNNSNLGEETTVDDVLLSVDYAEKVSEMSGLPIKMTTVKSELYPSLQERMDNLFPIELYVRQSWLSKAK